MMAQITFASKTIAETALVGYREDDILNNYHLKGKIANLDGYNTGKEGVVADGLFAESMQKLNLDLINKLAEYSQLPIITKGIPHPVDADAAIKADTAA